MGNDELGETIARRERERSKYSGPSALSGPFEDLPISLDANLLAALERANTILAELNFSEWIPKHDAPSIDIRQRINAAHVVASSALAEARKLHA